MILSGYPVETLKVEVAGVFQEVGTVYQWVNGKKRTFWDVPRSQFNARDVQRIPLPREALHRAEAAAQRRAGGMVKH